MLSKVKIERKANNAVHCYLFQILQQLPCEEEKPIFEAYGLKLLCTIQYCKHSMVVASQTP